MDCDISGTSIENTLMYFDGQLETDMNAIFSSAAGQVASDCQSFSVADLEAYNESFNFLNVDTNFSEHEVEKSPPSSMSPESSEFELPCLFDDVIDFSDPNAVNALEQPAIKEEHSYSNEIINAHCSPAISPTNPMLSIHPFYPQIKLESQSPPYISMPPGFPAPPDLVSPADSSSGSDSDTCYASSPISQQNTTVTYRGVPVRTTQISQQPPSHRSLYSSLPYNRRADQQNGVYLGSSHGVMKGGHAAAGLGLNGFTSQGYYQQSRHNGSHQHLSSRSCGEDLLSLPLTEEEKRTFIMEGYELPSEFPMSKSDEKNLKKVRRKLKNKWSAQESRRKKKEYVESIEQKCNVATNENQLLKDRVSNLEYDNKNLLSQLRALQQAVANFGGTTIKSVTSNNSTVLMMTVIFVSALFTSYMPFGEELSLNPQSVSIPMTSGGGVLPASYRRGGGFIISPFAPDRIVLQDKTPYTVYQESMKSRVLFSLNSDNSGCAIPEPPRGLDLSPDKHGHILGPENLSQPYHMQKVTPNRGWLIGNTSMSAFRSNPDKDAYHEEDSVIVYTSAIQSNSTLMYASFVR